MIREVVFIDSSNSLHNDKIGGTNSIVRRLVPEIKNKGVKVIFYDLSNSPAKSIHNSVDEYVRVTSLLKLYRLLRIKKDSIIIDIYLRPNYRIFYALLRLGKLCNSNSFRKIYFSFPKSRVKRFISFGDSLVKYSAVFVISERQKRYLQTQFGINPTLIYPPVDDFYFKESPVKDQNKFIIAWIGRLDSGKGADMVFEIIKAFTKYKNIEIQILAHSINNSNSIKTPAWVDGSVNIKYQEIHYGEWTEKVDREVFKMLSQANCFISPYRNLESTIDCPMLIQESSSAGCIVITEDYEINKKLLGNTGLLIDKKLNDTMKIASYIQAVNNTYTNYTKNIKFRSSPQKKNFRSSYIVQKLMS